MMRSFTGILAGDWRFIRWAILSILAMIVAFGIGCISVGHWASKTAEVHHVDELGAPILIMHFLVA
jgi:hypothetical protein